MKIYLEFGFKAYKGNKVVNWPGSSCEFNNNQLMN